MFRIKMILSLLADIVFVNKIKMTSLNKKTNSNYIRIVNYHHVLSEDAEKFEKQLKWYKKNYNDVNFDTFKSFVNGESLNGGKPGLMITFDDGYKDNYDVAMPLLNKYGFTGYFMVSSDLVGESDYMTEKMLLDLLDSNHVIGDHTATHHRFNPDDSEDVLNKEIVESKAALEKMLNRNIDIFCWCGGEEQHYTADAAKVIYSAGYKYSFLTNSFPVFQNNNLFLLERTNIEASWPLFLVRFQLCGFMDKKYDLKRHRVENLLLDGMKKDEN